MTDENKPITWEEPGPPVQYRLVKMKSCVTELPPATLADVRAALEPMGLRVVPSGSQGLYDDRDKRIAELEKELADCREGAAMIAESAMNQVARGAVIAAEHQSPSPGARAAYERKIDELETELAYCRSILHLLRECARRAMRAGRMASLVDWVDRNRDVLRKALGDE